MGNVSTREPASEICNLVRDSALMWACQHVSAHSQGNLKFYVYRGQRIWNVELDKTPKPWASWRQMPDRGDDTQNHWYVMRIQLSPKVSKLIGFPRDRPHISFYPASTLLLN